MKAVEEQDQEFHQKKLAIRKQKRKQLMKRLLGNKLFVFGFSIVLFVLLVTFIAPYFLPYDPYEMKVSDRLQGPSSVHLLGTDEYGRDLLTRIIYGAQVSMKVGLIVTLISSILGLIIGLYASYYRFLDHLLMRICDGLIAIPAILLAIALMAALGPSSTNVVIALSIVFTPHVARVVRSSALVIKEQTYIEAVQSQGGSASRIIWLHIAPNTLSILIVQASFIFAETIISEAALSFLGAGIPTPDPSWGNILQAGKLVIFSAWWMVVFPAVAIVLSVLGLNLLGDGLRDLLDPHATTKKRIKRLS